MVSWEAVKEQPKKYDQLWKREAFSLSTKTEKALG